MRIALVVTTYERPDALARVLASVAAQSRPPDEVAIADDGSGPATAEVVRAHAAAAPWPVHHAWQPHEGFRAARARNAAVALTSAEYLVLIDGDMVLDPCFLTDHAAAASTGAWVQGCRLPLNQPATAAVLRGDPPDSHRGALDWRHRLQARRHPALAQRLHDVAPAVLATKACNQGLWRADFDVVNGYDEAFVGWGAEDKDLCTRLGNAGLRRHGLLWAALAWHLWHPPAPRAAAARNAARHASARAERRVRCKTGLDRHRTTR